MNTAGPLNEIEKAAEALATKAMAVVAAVQAEAPSAATSIKLGATLLLDAMSLYAAIQGKKSS